MKHSTSLILVIKCMLNHPILTILLPITLVFITGYDIIYQFTILKLNSVLNNRYFGSPVPKNYEFLNKISALVKSDLTDYQGTMIIFQSNNVLDMQYLKDLSSQLSNMTYVMAPFNDWQFDFNYETSHSLLATLNYNSNYLVNSCYLDDVELSDFLITKATTLKVFILHKGPIHYLLNELNYYLALSTEDTSLIRDFLNYYLLMNDHTSILLSKVLTTVSIIGSLYLMFHLYLSISNLHKLRSNFGILMGWMIEVLLSAAAAIKIIELTSEVKVWNQLFEPFSFFTTTIFLINIGIISSRNVIRTINDLAYKNVYLESKNDDADYSLKRLYRFYIGRNNNPDTKFEKLEMIRSFLNHAGLKIQLKVPNITKILILDICSLFAIKQFSREVISFCFQGRFESYFDLKIRNFFKGIILTLVIDHCLQLTFLVGIILIDNYRVDLTKFLNQNNFPIHEFSNELNLEDMNLFSYYLLRSKPPRSSFRYKLGTNLTFMIHPTSLISWVIILPILQSANIFTVFMNWSIYSPYNLINNSEIIMTLNVTESNFDMFYYLEFLATLIFILSVSFIIFRLSNFKVNNINDQVEIFDDKVFKSIDLQQHSSDIIKLKSGNSSFLISVGLDHKVLVWSPLKPSTPPDLSSTIILDRKREFWPINHLNISANGEFIILINNKFGIIRCFERMSHCFKWTLKIDQALITNKILDSFFREKTLPGYLKLKVMKNRPRSNSEVSINGNYPRDLSSRNQETNLKKLEFIMILESGHILTYSCNDGTVQVTNILKKFYDIGEVKTQGAQIKLINAKKLVTPRVNDRIVCQVSNLDLLVAVAVNNKWTVLSMETIDNSYNQQGSILPTISVPMSLSNSEAMNFSFEGALKVERPIAKVIDSKYQINKPLIVTLEFVGMFIRVNNMAAELIDTQTGIVMNTITIGHFKPSSFRVSHLEPSHCRFCGCASISSLSIAYEDYDSKTLMIHTLKIQNNRAKTNICLRVERDPREIRCVGFNNVNEERYWFENINSWEVTDINIIIGSRKEATIENVEAKTTEFNSSKLLSLKNKRTKPRLKKTELEGFIITLNDGDLKPYKIPGINEMDLSSNHTCIEKFGYKAIAMTFGSMIKVLYLGNDKLVEENLYFNDVNSPINNQLMFLSKRRKR